MYGLRLIIGNQRYSSWSLRPWLLLKMNDIAFSEEHISLYQGSYKEVLKQHSPVGKVPVLCHDHITVWDSLSICEYIAEQLQPRYSWPKDVRQRALARSVCAEMHCSFMALRSECPMNVARTPAPVALSEMAHQDLDRVTDLLSDCLQQSGGPFLFQDFSIADAYFAPVMIRMDRYCLLDKVGSELRAYCAHILALPAMQEWVHQGRAEAFVLPQFEK